MSSALPACGGTRADEASEAEGAGSSSEGALALSADERAVLDGLRGRVTQDFAGVASLEGYKLVFQFRVGEWDRLRTDGTKAFVRARIMKRSADGHDFFLTEEDFVGSAFQVAIEHHA